MCAPNPRQPPCNRQYPPPPLCRSAARLLELPRCSPFGALFPQVIPCPGLLSFFGARRNLTGNGSAAPFLMWGEQDMGYHALPDVRQVWQ